MHSDHVDDGSFHPSPALPQRMLRGLGTRGTKSCTHLLGGRRLLSSFRICSYRIIHTVSAEPPWTTLGAFKASCAYPQVAMSDPLSTHHDGPQTSEERLSAARQTPEALRGWAFPRPGRHPGAGLPWCSAATLRCIIVTKAQSQTSWVRRRGRPCSRHHLAPQRT